jgi:drug/metabolite transporter (DMT)-like permease
VALALSLGGVLCLVGLPGSDTMHPTGVLLGLSAAAVYAVYVPLIGQLQSGVSTARATWLISIGVTAVFAVATPWRGEFTMALPPRAWAAGIAVGVFSTAIGLMAFMRGLRVLGPVRASIICTVEPVFAAVMGAVILAQPITPALALGGALILSAVVLLTLAPARGVAGAPVPAPPRTPTT